MNLLKNILRLVLSKLRRYSDGFNWPKSFLALGFAEYAGIGLGDDVTLCDVKERRRILLALEVLCDDWFARRYRLQHPDDAIFGYVLLQLADEIGRKDYCKSYSNIYRFPLGAARDQEGVLHCFIGGGSDHALINGIGQTALFLGLYGSAFGFDEARYIGLRQFDLFAGHAMDIKSGRPYHAYLLGADGFCCEKLGIVGCGRGAGQFLLDFCGYSEYHELAQGIVGAAEALQDESGFWLWQLQAIEGSRNTSAAVMIAYSMMLGGLGRREAVDGVVEEISACIDELGRVGSVLNDGCSIVQHSQNYDCHQWGQGIALVLLARHARALESMVYEPA